MTLKIGNPEENNIKLIKMINLVRTNNEFINNDKDFRDFIIKSINEDSVVLDIGKSMRDKYNTIKSNKKHTLDLNKFSDYPDFQMDLSDENLEIEKTPLYKKFDVIVCLAVLEHVYYPFVAIKNLKKMLKNNGTLYGYVPFLYFYHAPKSLKFQDFYRYSKDGLAYLFKDFKEITLFPNRGRIPTGLHILLGSLWKKIFERKIISFLLNSITSNLSNTTQTSGYYFSVKNYYIED